MKNMWFDNYKIIIKPYSTTDRRKDGRLIVELPYGAGKKVYKHRITAKNYKKMNELGSLLMCAYDQLWKYRKNPLLTIKDGTVEQIK